ncbi:MAG: hypothetical protein AMJ46_10860 [Latescibacteria bacterium DG_63]|nr:MAG: hypothetical protein AMJ46_10860 [Latescibacteria bacterium DG_63]
MGLSGIFAQILLIRELLTTFFGNELSIGIILANWLILEAAGSFFLGKTIERVRDKLEVFVGTTLVFSLSFPLAIYLTRTWKQILGTMTGEGLGFLPIVYSSFLILLPVSVSHGALFTFGCKIMSLRSRNEARSIGKVYVYETLGTIAGGLVLTYLLVAHFHSLHLAVGLALLNIAVCLYLLIPPLKGSRVLVHRLLLGTSAFLLVLCMYVLFSSRLDELHWLSIQKQWNSQNVVYYQNSIYGNLVVTKEAEQYTFFSDGIPIIATPTPDIVFVEETAHLPMLFHPNPKEVLIISGGAGGLIGEVLKHPVERTDYVELDPSIIEAVKRFPTALTEAELSDPRVNVHYTDGRFFLRRTPRKYDVVLIGLSNPSDLQTNRLFTTEFFSLARDRLKEGGLLAITLPGSLTYLSRELRNLNACILNSLKEVYPYVRIVPGDAANLFLASMSQNLSRTGEADLSQRLGERALEVNLITAAHIEYKLHPRWLNWFLESLEGNPETINRDFKPIAVFYSLSYWNSIFSPRMQRVLARLDEIDMRWVSALLAFSLGILLLLHFRARNLSKLSIPLAIASTGFAGMIFDLTLIFAFQTFYGYVFYWIAVLITAFTAGVAIGGAAMTSLMVRIEKNISYLLRIEAAIVLFSMVLPFVLFWLGARLDLPVVSILLQVLFLALAALSGILIGLEFPLANKIYLGTAPREKSGVSVGGTAGLLYGSDLMGGWLAGMVGGVVLLPVLGVLNTCLVVVVLKISSITIILVSARRILSRERADT